MKTILALALLSLSLTSFAQSVEEVVKEVEATNDASCVYTGKTFATCLGQPQTCLYSFKYACSSTKGDFKLRVRVIDGFNGTEVRGVKIIR